MTGTNHMLAGSIIGAVVASPVVIPLAFVSHFMLDMLPHYGIDDSMKRAEDVVWKFDVVLIIVFSSYVSLVSFDAKAWALVGAVTAVLPDFAWVYRFAIKERFGAKQPVASKNRFNQFHKNIQKRESTKMLWIEIASIVILSGIFIIVIN